MSSEIISKIILVTLNMMKTIRKLKVILRNSFEIILGKFPRAEIK